MFVRMQDGGICNLQNAQSVEKVALYSGTFVVNAIFDPNQAVELFRGTEQQCDGCLDFLWDAIWKAGMNLSSMPAE